MFLAPRQSQEPPWYYTRCELLLKEVWTQSAGKDTRHAFRKEWCNIIGRLIYRLEMLFINRGRNRLYTYQTLPKLAEQLTMYPHSDYKYPTHDGRVLDVEKNGLYTGEKKRRINLPTPKVKGAK